MVVSEFSTSIKRKSIIPLINKLYIYIMRFYFDFSYFYALES